jgi:hypothetical protein
MDSGTRVGDEVIEKAARACVEVVGDENLESPLRIDGSAGSPRRDREHQHEGEEKPERSCPSDD